MRAGSTHRCGQELCHPLGQRPRRCEVRQVDVGEPVAADGDARAWRDLRPAQRGEACAADVEADGAVRTTERPAPVIGDVRDQLLQVRVRVSDGFASLPGAVGQGHPDLIAAEHVDVLDVLAEQ